MSGFQGLFRSSQGGLVAVSRWPGTRFCWARLRPAAAAPSGHPGLEASRAAPSMKSSPGGILFMFAFVYAKLMVSAPLI